MENWIRRSDLFFLVIAGTLFDLVQAFQGHRIVVSGMVVDRILLVVCQRVPCLFFYHEAGGFDKSFLLLGVVCLDLVMLAE